VAGTWRDRRETRGTILESARPPEANRTDVARMTDDERRAFREAMTGVRPLPAPRRAASPPPAVPRFARADRRQGLRESLLPPADPAVLESGEETSFRRPWVRAEVLRRLRRGDFRVAADCDLHGLGRHAAREALRGFVAESLARGLGCVCVIHGKGRGSGPSGPVLKHAVGHWLQHMDDVLAFASARPVDGGTGALYVLLAIAPRRGPSR
jgi:DNA-nicking Smr family endonuclease